MTKVEEVFEALQKKHGSSYKPEQLWAWANMIQMQKHTTVEEPPSSRYLDISRKQQQRLNRALHLLITTQQSDYPYIINV